jgi:hypothetical protein
MREVIRGHQMHSDAITDMILMREVIRGHQMHSDAILCNRMRSYAILCDPMRSHAIRGHQGLLACTRCNQRSSGAARLHEPDLFERGARSDTKLSLDEVDAGHLLRDSVLNLRASGAR